jgi:hypothetical protein
MNKRYFYIFAIVLGLALVLAACGGAATTPAPVVEPTEAPATEAPTAVPTVDPAAAIEPIFAASGHADAAALAFTDWDEADPKEVPVNCAKCHTSAGYQDFIADGKVDAAVPAGPSGTLECATCHNDTAKVMTSVTFPSGIVVENLGPEAICMTCHQGRQSKVSVDKKITDFAVTDVDAVVAPIKDKDGKDVFFTFPNVHYFAAGGTLYGGQVKMGYEYDGKLYDAKNQHVGGFDTCLGCHDQHSLEVKVEACSECHQGVASVDDLKNIREPSSAQDYDGDGDKAEGVAFEIAGLQETLLASIQAYAKEVAGKGITYDTATHPYWFVDEDGDGKPDQKDGKNVNYNAFTARLMKATYNYQVSVKDPGAFAHGGKYIIELLVDSIEDLNASEKLTTKFDATTLTREDTGHFNGARETWRHWDFDDDGNPVYTVEAACAKCHSGSALPMVLAGETIPEAGVPAGNGLMCLTCHDGANFPGLIAGNEVAMPSGKAVSFGEGAASNLCIECHQGRTSKVTIDKKIEQFAVADKLDEVVAPITVDGKEVKFSFSNAHYLGIAAMWFGTDAQGFYEYEGKTYVGTNPHVVVNDKPGCVGCHDAHTGAPDEESCKTCHGDVTMNDLRGMSSTGDYNGNGDTKEGLRAEYRALRDVLYVELQKYAKTTAGTGITYNPDVYPYWFVDANGDDKADEVDGKTVTFSSWTPRLLKAAYNFNFLRKNPDVHIHNGKYGIQIAIDTIEDLGGDVTKFVRP